MLKFPQFQLEDIPRLAILDSAICAWEQGLGKSIAAIALALIKRARRILLIAPDDLHHQHQKSAMDFFSVYLSPLERIEQIEPFGLHIPVPDDSPPRFFITSFHNLGLNHADEWPDHVEGALAKTKGHRRKARIIDLEQIVPAAMRAFLQSKRLDPNEWFSGIGAERTYENGHTVKCVWKPTMARVLAMLDCFDMVLVDEGTIIQADDAHLATGVRILNPRYRYLFTGTPIKNRVESIFWLLKWVSGNDPNPTARMPYRATADAREQFALDFLQHDEFLTREEEAEHAYHQATGKRRSYKIVKRTARLCNVHRFWKLISPMVLRRRKDDCGLPIVRKIVTPIYIPPGRTQQAVYQFHLNHPPQAARGTPHKPVDRRVQIGMQLNVLRQVALCPHAEQLQHIVTNNSAFQGQMGPKRSHTDMNPKMAAILAKLAEILATGEQAIIGSPFEPFNTALHRRLVEAGVSAILLDGSVPAKRRGQLAQEFKQRGHSVVVAGLKAMGKGHSFECAKYLFLPSLSFALDENEQFIHRVWRLNSRNDVTIIPFVMSNTIDELMAADFSDKLDSSQLGLDGCLTEQQIEQIDLTQLLEKAVRNFNPVASTLDEADMEREWNETLRQALSAAERRFREFHTHQHLSLSREEEGPSPLALALAMKRRIAA